ncbi:MAG: CBS domain-containing protein [Chloroflexi bacterium]|nr:CBS domain-containing protein [Chloroflexota bacterium]
MRLELVKDWMTRDVTTITPDTGVLEAGNMMRENGIRRLPVMVDGRVIGIITHGDIREAKPSTSSSLSAWEMNYLLARFQISEIMSSDPLTISPDATIGEAAYLMYKNKISSLPVIDADENLAGIITESDIFRMVVYNWIKTQEGTSSPYSHYNE